MAVVGEGVRRTATEDTRRLKVWHFQNLFFLHPKIQYILCWRLLRWGWWLRLLWRFRLWFFLNLRGRRRWWLWRLLLRRSAAHFVTWYPTWHLNYESKTNSRHCSPPAPVCRRTSLVILATDHRRNEKRQPSLLDARSVRRLAQVFPSLSTLMRFISLSLASRMQISKHDAVEDSESARRACFCTSEARCAPRAQFFFLSEDL